MRAARRRPWAGCPGSASGRPCITARTSPTSCRTSGTSATTGTRSSRSRTSTSTRRRCGRWTRPRGSRSSRPTSSSTRCRRKSASRTWRATRRAGPRAGRRRRAPRPDATRRVTSEQEPARSREPAGSAPTPPAARGPSRHAMGNMHTVRFEPVGIEMEADEDETILHAAFRQGIMLMHGCKEGQCSACKSFLLDGDVDLDKYSTFALPDFEEAEGWTLLCRAHAYSDLEVELINYDEEALHGGTPPRTVRATVSAIEALTHDITRLCLTVDGGEPFSFKPGQYVDIRIPGGDEEEHRSFSMASLAADSGELEFMIKRYPGGRFSGLLGNDGLKVGDALEVTGPYGVFTLRASSPRRIVFTGGGAGMAPILCLLRSMAEAGVDRPARYYYGARTETDLFPLEELSALAARLPGFTFVPALSEESNGGWAGESGLITDVVERMEDDLGEVDAYLCGPPPMVDAAIAMLERLGVPESHIYFDKFTTTEHQ